MQLGHAGRIRLASSSNAEVLVAIYAESAKQFTESAGYATSVKQ